MNKQKDPFIAFLLAFFPGGGLLYLGKFLQGLVFLFLVIGSIPFAFLIGRALRVDALIMLILGGGVLVYVISIVNTAMVASKWLKENAVNKETLGEDSSQLNTERFYTIILSFIPGLGHFQLGLMNRGVTFLASFLGITAMIMFVTVITGREEFLVFLMILPVILVYNFFDTMKLLNKKQAGEELSDQSILEDLEARHEDGKKSKTIATFLSMFPGVGHLYLGYQRRGIQLMAAFLFSIYILDILRLGIFLFLVPMIWFYSFFDGLQKTSKHGKEPVEDEPIVSYFINQKKWMGIGLVVLGVYYLATSILVPAFSPMISQYFNIDIYRWMYTYLQTGLVCLLLIVGGIKLMSGSKKQSPEKGE
jgi:TM2 domain-containing membrane protein YozV